MPRVVLILHYLSDLTCCIRKHIVYADDLTKLETDKILHHSCQRWEVYLEEVVKWCKKWRTKVKFGKTDITLFTKTGSSQVTIDMGGNILKQVTSKKCLGVIVDDKLYFNGHIKHVCSTALWSLIIFTHAMKHFTIVMALHIYK